MFVITVVENDNIRIFKSCKVVKKHI